MKRTLFFAFLLLVGCSKSEKPSKLEIEALCKSVGNKAYSEALINKHSEDILPSQAVRLAENIGSGSEAECKLKYLTDN